MFIIGCDFHSRFQQVGMLEHENGEAKAFSSALPSPARVGMEATCDAQWFERILREHRHELWIGDAAAIRAAIVRKQEWKAYGQLSGDQNESAFASALEQGFRSAGWKSALSKGIETRQAQRKNGYYSALMIAMLCADLGDKDQAFQWLNTAYQERDQRLVSLKTYFQFDSLRADQRFAELVSKIGLP